MSSTNLLLRGSRLHTPRSPPMLDTTTSYRSPGRAIS